MKINFFGDFVAPTIKTLKISERLSSFLKDGDLNVINFEAPILPSTNISGEPLGIEKSGPNLCQNESAPQWLEDNGFSIVSFSNNHIMDYGKVGLVATRNAFKKAKIIGAGEWDNAYQPCIIEIDGKKIGILALAHYEFGMLADKWDSRYDSGVAWINFSNVNNIIIETRKKVDFLIVFAHAGVENIEQPLPEWRDRYYSFIDLGCDAVIASHPHIIQGWELYRNKPIVYSLGNFYFPKDIPKSQHWYKSVCAQLSISNSNEIVFSHIPLYFKNGFIDFDESIETQEYIKKVNIVLKDKKLYMEYINNVCISMLKHYEELFSYSGYVNIKNPSNVIKQMMRYMLKHHFLSSTHLNNNLRCESHQWCISRGLKIRDNYQ